MIFSFHEMHPNLLYICVSKALVLFSVFLLSIQYNSEKVVKKWLIKVLWSNCHSMLDKSLSACRFPSVKEDLCGTGENPDRLEVKNRIRSVRYMNKLPV